jgi:hypothetical protein
LNDRLYYFSEAKLKRAFMKVAQNQEVLNDWRILALALGLPEDHIDGIEEGATGPREQCHRALLLWKENDPLASVNTLSRFLKKIKCRSAAGTLVGKTSPYVYYC